MSAPSPSAPVPTLASCRVDDSRYTNISLVKLAGKAVVDIHGYVSTEFGDPVFKISTVVFADGEKVWVDGEHDFPYIGEVPNVPIETLEAILKESDEAS